MTITIPKTVKKVVYVEATSADILELVEEVLETINREDVGHCDILPAAVLARIFEPRGDRIAGYYMTNGVKLRLRTAQTAIAELLERLGGN